MATASNGLMTPQQNFAVINTSASGDAQVVAAVSGRAIRVTQYTVVNAAAQQVFFRSGSGGTALTGPMPFGLNGGTASAFNPNGLFQTAVGAGLFINLSAANLCGGHLEYEVVIP